MRLTTTKEDYLRALFILQERKAAPVRAIDIARYLRLGRSTVSERLQEMIQQRLVTHSHYGDVALTRKGYLLGKNLTRKHRLIEVFLLRTLNVPAKDVHAEAHKLEHAMSDGVVEKLSRFLKDPTVDPHGARIPSRSR